MNASDDTYRDVVDLLNHMSWQAVKKWGGEFDDFLSVANEAYCRAYRGFDRQRGVRFSTYLWHCVRRAFLDHLAEERRWRGEDSEVLDQLLRPEVRGIERIMGELSDDARTIARLFIDTPAELAELITPRNPARTRRAVWGYLRDMGWSMGRVVVGFEEIRGAVSK